MYKKFIPRNGNTNFSNNKNKRKRQPNLDVIRSIENAASAPRIQVPQEETVHTSTGSFDTFALSPQLRLNLKSRNYIHPTPIQEKAIPAVLKGRDVIGIANTGTGKTAAFLIPLIEKISKNRSEKVLIVTPTRELACQIEDELRLFSRGMGLYSVLCIGGSGYTRQRNDLRRNPHFIIGTPGRIRDFIQDKSLSLSNVSNVVLDEVDRMVDIGFIGDIRYFLSLLPRERQSLFFSATVPANVNGILNSFVSNPVTISVKQKEIVGTIEQSIVQVEEGQRKIDLLHDLLIHREFTKVLIFGRTKWGVQKLSDELIHRGFKAGAIHGDKRQNQRQQILDQFKQNKITILLATDVASRGLDIGGISHVINYDIPDTYEDYVHRIGRTGRLDKRGSALTFIENTKQNFNNN